MILLVRMMLDDVKQLERHDTTSFSAVDISQLHSVLLRAGIFALQSCCFFSSLFITISSLVSSIVGVPHRLAGVRLRLQPFPNAKRADVPSLTSVLHISSQTIVPEDILSHQ